MPKNNVSLHPSYTFKGVERIVNKAIAFVFYYRIVLVLVCIVILGFIGRNVWTVSKSEDQLKNLAIVFTCGSIIIAIFYSVLNYEYTQIRFKHDRKNTIDTLTFNIASKSHDERMIYHFKTLAIFYETNQDFTAQAFSKALQENHEARTSFAVIFNYFECIAVGIEQGLIDEEFTMEFFKTIIKTNYDRFNAHIEYLRKSNNTDRIFKSYTKLALRWKALD